jgi:hypothetical protein
MGCIKPSLGVTSPDEGFSENFEGPLARASIFLNKVGFGQAIISQFLLIRWVTIFSRPSKVISNIGKISLMTLMVLV